MLADRGYCSEPLRQQLRDRDITPGISQRRFSKNTPLQPGQTTRPGTRGRAKVTRTSDPEAPSRWVIERTNAWILAFRRITIRREPNSQHWHAYLTLAILIILTRSF